MNLSDNYLMSIPESIENLSTLENLYLFNNQLTSLPSTICNITEWCYIGLNGNNLCEEYNFDCINESEWGTQDQSDCP